MTRALNDVEVDTMLQAIRDANADVLAAGRRGPGTEAAQERLQHAVDRARAAGLNWGPIAAAIGIARGAAYHRYQRDRRFGWSAAHA